MNKWCLKGLLLIVLTLAPAYAMAMDLATYRARIAGDREDRHGIAQYLSGLYDGIQVANVRLRISKQETLYCAPPDFVVKPENLQAVIESEVSRVKYTNDQQVAIILVLALQAVFPCKSD